MKKYIYKKNNSKYQELYLWDIVQEYHTDKQICIFKMINKYLIHIIFRRTKKFQDL